LPQSLLWLRLFNLLRRKPLLRKFLPTQTRKKRRVARLARPPAKPAERVRARVPARPERALARVVLQGVPEREEQVRVLQVQPVPQALRLPWALRPSFRP